MRNNKLDAIDALIAELPDTGPPTGDEFTVTQWMERRGLTDGPIGQQQAYRELRKLIAQGNIKSRTGKIGSRQGNIYVPTK